MPSLIGPGHAWRNRLHSWLLIGVLFGIAGLAGFLLSGKTGLLLSLGACVIAVLIEPVTASQLTLRLYHARPVAFAEAPELCALLQQIAAQAGLATPPSLYLIPSPVMNAFSIGSSRDAIVAVSAGLLRALGSRELTGVLAHEVAHIARGDLRVMNLADYVSRLTGVFALVGQVSLLLALPRLAEGGAEINWIGLLVLAISPHIALVAQLGLSQVREFDADLEAVRLTGDTRGLASALAKIERANRLWSFWWPGGWSSHEPSWLRTHPSSEERIRRLLALS